MARGPTGGAAAGLLREMYGGSLPRVATQLLRDHAQARSASAPAPSGKSTWPARSNSLAPRPENRRVEVKAPRVGCGYNSDLLSRPPRLPLGKKSQAQILVETSDYERIVAAPVAGRDNEAIKRRLQDRLAYDAQAALPGLRALPAPAPAPRPSRHVTFANRPYSSDRAGTPQPQRTGLTAEQERLASEIVLGVRDRQQELESVESSIQDCSEQVGLSGDSTERRRLLRLQMGRASKRRLELQTAIRSDVQDLQQILDSAPIALG